MTKVVFTSNIQRHVDGPEADAVGRTVREVLENVFAINPQAASPVEHGRHLGARRGVAGRGQLRLEMEGYRREVFCRWRPAISVDMVWT